jgi:hypothetical protein
MNVMVHLASGLSHSCGVPRAPPRLHESLDVLDQKPRPPIKMHRGKQARLHEPIDGAPGNAEQVGDLRARE